MKCTPLIIALNILFLTSCYKDSEEFTEKDPFLPQSSNLMEYDGKIIGYVYDINKQPVSDATVSIYSASTTTNDYGVFIFDQVKLDPNGTYVKVNKEGYMLGSDLLYPIKGDIQSSIQMYVIDNKYSITAESGGTIDIAEGGKLIFPANAIVQEDGSNFTGVVKVSAQYLNPDDKNLSDKMPGGLIGLDEDGNHQVLGTYGMMAVELRNDAGEELHIKESSQVVMEFPAPEVSGSLPSTVPLWSFDEDAGLWKEEGAAQLEGSVYRAEVSHFSFWNCDAPFPLVHVCGTVLYSDQSPAKNYRVKILVDGIGTGYGIVDEDGKFCGKMPKNEKMTILVINPVCNEVVAEKVAGPFSADDEIETIVIDKNTQEVSGIVLCKTEFLPGAIVVIKAGENTFLIETDEAGKFTYLLDNKLCGEVTSFGIFAFHPMSGEASQEKELDFTNGIDVEMNVCSSCEFVVTIDEELENPCNVQEKKLTAEVEGINNIAYNWSSGSSDATISVSLSGVYCVTVTNTDEGCDMVNCKEIEVNINLADSSFVYYTDCSMGNIDIQAFGGVAPYLYSTQGPNGYTSVDNFMSGLQPGLYTTTITDNAECSIVTENLIEEGGNLEINLTTYNNCNDAYIQVERGQASGFVSYLWSTGDNSPEISVVNDGEYCVTVADNNGCTESQCIDVVIEYVDYQLDYGNCENNVYNILIPDSNLTLTIYLQDQEMLELIGESEFDFDVLQNGFGFSYFGFNQNGGDCQFESYVELPQFKGLTIGDITNTTCGTCNDGNIEILVDGGADCRSCTIGEKAVYAKGDLTKDLTTENDAGMMAAGEYYIVLKDMNSGCIIAYEIVKIE